MFTKGPNTALLFCAAGYRSSLLRTFREHDLNFYLASASIIMISLVRATNPVMRSGLKLP